MAYGKSVNLFLVNGKADSLVIAELKNWDAKAIRIPRIEVPGCDRDELKQQGVYFLICSDPNTGDRSVYIGETDEVKKRLIEHIQANKADKEKFYWHTAICFTSSSLNKTFVRYIENKCCDIAKRIKRYGVLTQQTYTNTIISESDQAAMDEFIDNMKIVLGTLGCEALEPLNTDSADGKSDADRRLYLSMGAVKAEGESTTDGFVVFKGATINAKTNFKSLNKNAAVKRDAMIASDKVENNTTTEDILFTSPSAAADFLVGYSVSGPANWKDKKGTALKDRTDI